MTISQIETESTEIYCLNENCTRETPIAIYYLLGGLYKLPSPSPQLPSVITTEDQLIVCPNCKHGFKVKTSE